MLQPHCNAKELAEQLDFLIQNKEAAKIQINESKTALKMLGLGSKENPSQKAAREILNYTKSHL